MVANEKCSCPQVKWGSAESQIFTFYIASSHLPHMDANVRSYILPCLTIAFLILNAGCTEFGDVGPEFRIDTGIEPENQDNNVRFRTTYYFRVFDYCEKLSDADRKTDYEEKDNLFTTRKNGQYKILKDSLYRFKMTGQASALFSKVNFESGALKAEQIDPFGSYVNFDSNGRPQIVSAQELHEKNDRQQVEENIRRLVSLRKDLKDIPDAGKRVDSVIEQTIDLLGPHSDPKSVVGDAALISEQVKARQHLDKIVKAAERANVPKVSGLDTVETKDSIWRKEKEFFRKVSDKALEQVGKMETAQGDREKELSASTAVDKKKELQDNLDLTKKELSLAKSELQDILRITASHLLGNPTLGTTTRSENSSDACSKGARPTRGFQVLGPEGFREFDPGERLVMAMTSDAKPLVNTLQALSGRNMQTDISNSPQSRQLVANDHERLVQSLMMLARYRNDLLSADDLSKDTLSITDLINRLQKVFEDSQSASKVQEILQKGAQESIPR